MCSSDGESILHCLVTYPRDIEVWKASPIGWTGVSCVSMDEWWCNVIDRCTDDDLQLAAVILWSLWNNRNDMVWNLKHKAAIRIVHDALSFLQQWIIAQQLPSIRNNQQCNQGTVSWIKPPSGVVTCNVDAALFSSTKQFGFGCVVRDSEGHFCGARSVTVFYPLMEPALAEAMSLREALSWLKTCSFPSIILELDSLLVVQAIHSSATDRSFFGHVIADCKLLISEINVIKISFVKRSANQVTHCLAKASVFWSEYKKWLIEPPSFVINVLNFDLQ